MVQGEYAKKKDDKTAKGKVQTNITSGDIMMLQIVFTYLSIKLEKLIYNNNFKAIKSDVDNTISMVRDVLSQKSLKSLMRSYIRVIPKFFKFNHCSIMFFDNEKGLLYTITFGDDEDQLNEYK